MKGQPSTGPALSVRRWLKSVTSRRRQNALCREAISGPGPHSARDALSNLSSVNCLDSFSSNSTFTASINSGWGMNDGLGAACLAWHQSPDGAGDRWQVGKSCGFPSASSRLQVFAHYNHSFMRFKLSLAAASPKSFSTRFRPASPPNSTHSNAQYHCTERTRSANRSF